MDKKFIAILVAVVVVAAVAIGVVSNGKNSDIADLKAQVDDLTAQVTDLTAQLDTANSDLASTQEALAAAEELAASLEETAAAEADLAEEALDDVDAMEEVAAEEANLAEEAEEAEAPAEEAEEAAEEPEEVAEEETAEEPETVAADAETAPVVASVDDGALAADAQAEVDVAAYDAESEEIYMATLGDFYEAYTAAKSEVLDLDKRLGLMAVAEAKLMESGIILPIQSNGGSYQMTRVAPHTHSYVSWGYDEYRYDNVVVANELIKTEDIDALNALYNEKHGTGEYEQAAKDYLTSHGYTLKNTYDVSYPSDPLTWDWLASSRTTTGEYCAPIMEGLLRYDIEDVQKPAMATSYEISDDGLTYTFHIREGVKWVDYQGRELDDVQADDWVAGMQHMVDTAGGLGDLLSNVVVNLGAYVNGEITDFSQVGVKAVDKYTLQYTLNEPTPWFLSMTGYSALAPMCRSYYESLGGKFGLADYDASCQYGTTPEYLAYNGAYLISNWTANNSINYVKNPTYWNADEVDILEINQKFNDSTDVTKDYTDTKTGVIDICALNTNVIETAKTEIPEGETESYYDLYRYVAPTDSTSFVGFYNVNRQRYSNFNDETKARSARTVAEADRTYKALQNAHFRLAMDMALDRGSYLAQAAGEDLKYSRITNSYTPGTFMSLANETTVDINGTATTFPAGTFYGEMMQAQIDADGVALKVWNPDTASSTQYDGWYSPENAMAEMNKAIEELAAEGVEVSAENPIHFDYAYYSSNATQANRASVVKQSIEASLNGLVVVDLVDTVVYDDYLYVSYNAEIGYEMNCDMYDGSGWGPDYGDVQTFLDTMLPYYDGYMTKCLGVF